MLEITPFRGRDFMDVLGGLERDIFKDTAEKFKGICRTDIEDRGDKFVLEAELPGFDKEDIKIDIERDYLTISAERKSRSESKDKNYIRRERSYGSFMRRFDISGIEKDGIQAFYKQGVLTLELPKKAVSVSAIKRLEIKGEN